MLLVDSSSSKSSEPCPVCQKKAVYQKYIKPSKVKRLKTFARLRCDRISLALAGKLETVEHYCG